MRGAQHRCALECAELATAGVRRNSFIALLLRIVAEATCGSVSVDPVVEADVQAATDEVKSELVPREPESASPDAPADEQQPVLASTRQPPNEQLVEQVTMQGVPLVRARRAVFATSNAGG